jgi:hypothetical protein
MVYFPKEKKYYTIKTQVDVKCTHGGEFTFSKPVITTNNNEIVYQFDVYSDNACPVIEKDNSFIFFLVFFFLLFFVIFSVFMVVIVICITKNKAKKIETIVVSETPNEKSNDQIYTPQVMNEFIQKVPVQQQQVYVQQEIQKFNNQQTLQEVNFQQNTIQNPIQN